MSDQEKWRRVSIVEAGRGQPPTPDFCLPNFLAGSVGVVAAPAGIGKTSLLLQLAAAVAASVPVVLMKTALGNSGLNSLTAVARDSRLLILDPIRSFHYCDEQDYGQMAMLFRLLADIAASTGCAILFSHHVPQPISENALDEPPGALGSDAFVNATRWVLNRRACRARRRSASASPRTIGAVMYARASPNPTMVRQSPRAGCGVPRSSKECSKRVN